MMMLDVPRLEEVVAAITAGTRKGPARYLAQRRVDNGKRRHGVKLVGLGGAKERCLLRAMQAPCAPAACKKKEKRGRERGGERDTYIDAHHAQVPIHAHVHMYTRMHIPPVKDMADR